MEKIPILIIPEGDIDSTGWKSEESKLLRCEHCGNALMYCAQMFGLVKKEYDRSEDFKVVGETEDSKRFRKYEISYVSEMRYCAVCKCPCGVINIRNYDEILHEFEDINEKEIYETALDILQYPNHATYNNISNFGRYTKQIREWVDEFESRQKKQKNKG